MRDVMKAIRLVWAIEAQTGVAGSARQRTRFAQAAAFSQTDRRI
jgi:hypothetical protein